MGGLVFWWGFSFLGFFVWLFSWVFLFCVGFLFFQDRVLLCGSGCPGTCSVDQGGLCLLSAGTKSMLHHHPAASCVLKTEKSLSVWDVGRIL